MNKGYIDLRSEEGQRLMAQELGRTPSPDLKTKARIEKLLASFGIPANTNEVRLVRGHDGFWSLEIEDCVHMRMLDWKPVGEG